MVTSLKVLQVPGLVESVGKATDKVIARGVSHATNDTITLVDTTAGIEASVFDNVGRPNFILFVFNAEVIVYLIWQHYVRRRARKKRKFRPNNICREPCQIKDNRRIPMTQTFHNQNQN